MLGDNGRTERGAERYLPFTGHIGPETVLLDNGSLLGIGHVQGQPFELADHAIRNARLRLLNTIYRNLADDNITIYTYLVRHLDKTAEARSGFRSSFAATLDKTYSRTVLKDRLYRNDYYVAIVVAPRSPLGTGVGKL